MYADESKVERYTEIESLWMVVLSTLSRNNLEVLWGGHYARENDTPARVAPRKPSARDKCNDGGGESNGKLTTQCQPQTYF